MAAHSIDGFARMKYFHILDGEGARLLTYILKLGTNAPTTPPGIKFDDYLNNPPTGFKINYASLSNQGKKMQFSSLQMNLINKDPMWDNFDITLLYKAIRLGNKDVAGLDGDEWKDTSKMEGLIRSLVDLKNGIVHDKGAVTHQDFDVKLKDLQDIFVKILEAAQKRYNVPEMDVEAVRNQILKNMVDINQTFTSMEAANIIMSKSSSFIAESQYYLKNAYQKDILFNPLSFLKDSPLGRIHVQSIYCDAYLEDKRENGITSSTINCLDLLSLAYSMKRRSPPGTSSQSTESRPPHVIMIDGDAGSGKTTLSLFMLSEWLKDAHHCRIAHLIDCNIMLRIVCREPNEPSLQQFLAKLLPDVFPGFTQCLEPLLKECSNVIFLIDGIEEMLPGSSSEQLVDDILLAGKGMNNVLFICTSRPNAASIFISRLPARYRTWELRMKAVSPEHRAKFVLKHYATFPGNNQANPDIVKCYMDKYGWKDHFGLPLNLLFVATLFHIDSDCIKNSSTQTHLYIKIHEWGVQKLHERLANRSNTQVNVQSCKSSVRKVLQKLYRVALESLLEDRLKFSRKDIARLSKCCNAENLPSMEILDAFFCLRERIVYHVSHTWYTAPQKSLHEFFAANCIVNKLVALRSKAQKPFSESIKQILGSPSPEQLRNLSNSLLHVLGLLCQLGDPSLSGAVQSVVELVALDGGKDCDSWLSLEDDAGIDEGAWQHIIQHIKDDGHEVVHVTASNIDRAESLLPLVPHKTVEIKLLKDVDINKLIKVCEKHNCTSLELDHHYKHPQQHSTSDCVLAACTWKDLEVFAGHLTCQGITNLQHNIHLRHLRLSLSDASSSQEIFPAITNVQPLLPNLNYLTVHVPVMTISTPWVTTSLPDVMNEEGEQAVALVLSGVNDTLVDTTCKAAQSLHPKYGYATITFPESNMSADSWRWLLSGVADGGVRVGRLGVVVPRNIPITEAEVHVLNNRAAKMTLGSFRRATDESLWWCW